MKFITLAAIAIASLPITLANLSPRQDNPAIYYQAANFEIQVAAYSNLTVYKPELPEGWYYLGPVASSNTVAEHNGIIVQAIDKDALADITDWTKVGPNNEPEPSPFSTWRGVAPEGYVVAGDFFVTGNDKPTPEQTAGLKAIRSDLVGQLEGQRLVWTGRQPSSVATIWDVVAVPLLYIPTGAFASSADDTPEDTKLAAVLFYKAKYSPGDNSEST